MNALLWFRNYVSALFQFSPSQTPNPSSNITADVANSVIELFNPITSESPISSFEISHIEWSNPNSPGKGDAVLFFCGEHDGYRMRVGYENGRKNGAATVYYPDGIAYMNVHFVSDVEEGDYLIRDEDGNVIEEGCIRNGKRHGLWKGVNGEYNYYYKGCVLAYCKELRLYWEMRRNDELVRVAQVDFELFLLDGICYEYEGGELKRECLYKKDVLMRVIREWDGDVMIEYKENGEKEYEGGYENSLKNNMRRMGYGKVFVNGKIAYGGYWEEGEIVWIDQYRNEVVGDRLMMNGELSGYWDVKDNNGDMVSTSQYNSLYSEKEGESYEYDHGELCEKSVYHGGKKTRVLAEWKNGKMIEYHENGKRSYEGGWKGNILSGFVREGEGNEYSMDGLSLVYKGHWSNGLKDGNGTWYKNGNGLPTYSGEWWQGYPNGIGCLKDENGVDLYRGKWENGYLHEYGLVWIDYESGWKYRTGDKRRLSNWVARGGEEPPGWGVSLFSWLMGEMLRYSITMR